MSAPVYEQTDFASDDETLVEWRHAHDADLPQHDWTATDVLAVCIVAIAAGMCALVFMVLFCLLAAVG